MVSVATVEKARERGWVRQSGEQMRAGHRRTFLDFALRWGVIGKTHLERDVGFKIIFDGIPWWSNG